MAMSRWWEALGIVAIAASLLTLRSGLERRDRHMVPAPEFALQTLDAALSETGLRRRDDVVIEMNGHEVARGFSRADCDGLLLVAVLPRTAQGWAHIAPRLDLESFRVRYIYDGVSHPRVPRLERLGDRLVGELRPDSPSLLPRVTAVAEAGSCGLGQRAASVLHRISRGYVPQTAPFGESV